MYDNLSKIYTIAKHSKFILYKSFNINYTYLFMFIKHDFILAFVLPIWESKMVVDHAESFYKYITCY